MVQGACTPLANIGLAVGVTDRQSGSRCLDAGDTARRAHWPPAAWCMRRPTATPSGAQSDKIIKKLGLGRTTLPAV